MPSTGDQGQRPDNAIQFLDRLAYYTSKTAIKAYSGAISLDGPQQGPIHPPRLSYRPDKNHFPFPLNLGCW